MKYDTITKFISDFGALIGVGFWMYFTIQQLNISVEKLTQVTESLDTTAQAINIRLENHEIRISNLEK